MMLVHDDDDQEPGGSKTNVNVQRHWKQVPIKEQSIACLSRASSLSGFGTLTKGSDSNNPVAVSGQLRGSKRRLSLYKV